MDDVQSYIDSLKAHGDAWEKRNAANQEIYALNLSARGSVAADDPELLALKRKRDEAEDALEIIGDKIRNSKA